MEPPTRIELVASSLPKRCSTTELRRQKASQRYSADRPRTYHIRTGAGNQVGVGPANSFSLRVLAWTDSKGTSRADLIDGHEVRRFQLGAIYAEKVDLADVSAARSASTVRMRAVAIEFNDSATQAPRFHLNAVELPVNVDGDIVSAVFSEREKQLKAGINERCNHVCFGNVADEFGVAQK